MADGDPAALCRAMVPLRSVSGEEAAVAAHLAAWCRGHGLAPRIEGRNVRLEVGTGERRLLLASHLDTVPVTPGWTRDPFAPGDDPAAIHGLGASDAKASIAAMAVACVRLAARGLPSGTAVWFAAVCDEEVGGQGMPVVAPTLPPMAGAVVGEPTALAICPGQRGLVRATGVATGRAGHASRPWEGRNAIQAAAADVERIGAMPLPPPDPLLGAATVCVTEIAGGTARNVVPAECRFTIDVRTIPAFDNAAAAETLRKTCRSAIHVASDRIRPVATPLEAAIVQAARSALPQAPVRGFGGVSDLAFLRGIPGIVCGPGEPARSHQPDEWIAADAVRAGADAFERIALAFLGLGGAPGRA